MTRDAKPHTPIESDSAPGGIMTTDHPTRPFGVQAVRSGDGSSLDIWVQRWGVYLKPDEAVTLCSLLTEALADPQARRTPPSGPSGVSAADPDVDETTIVRWGYSDEDLAVRVEALRASATTWQGVDCVAAEVISSARAFEAYLRGDQ